MSKIVENLTVGQEVICLYCDDRDGELIRGKNLKVSYIPSRFGNAYRVHDANHPDKEYKIRRKHIMEYERFSKYGFSENMINKLANGYCDGEACSDCIQHQLCNLSEAIEKVEYSCSSESSFRTYDDIVIAGILSKINILKGKGTE